MTTSMSSALAVCFAACAGLLTTAAPVSAQNTFFIDLHAGGQLRSSTLDTDTTFRLFDEDANIRTRQEPGAGGLFDVRFGFRFGSRVGAAFSVSGTETHYDGAVAASLPNPLVINQYENITQDVTGMTRRDLGYHVQFLYFVPLAEKLTLTLGAGPSFVQVQQPVIRAVVIPGTQNLDVSVPKNREVVPAFNVGADMTYAVTPRIGLGLFSRFQSGAKDFEDISGVSVTAVQVGGGLRVGF